MKLNESLTEKGKLEFYKNYFNGLLGNWHYPEPEEKVSFNIMNGNNLETYESSITQESALRKLGGEFEKKQVSTKMKVIEPSIIFDYDFFSKNICNLFNADKEQIEILSLDISEKEGYKSTYQITADIYPVAVTTIKKTFSLEKLYFAFAAATEKKKNLITEYLNLLKFKKIKSINYKRLKTPVNTQALDTIELTDEFEKKREVVLKEASKNACIIGMFNIDNPLLELETPTNNGYVDDMEAKKKQQFHKKISNFSKIFDDIDE